MSGRDLVAFRHRSNRACFAFNMFLLFETEHPIRSQEGVGWTHDNNDDDNNYSDLYGTRGSVAATEFTDDRREHDDDTIYTPRSLGNLFASRMLTNNYLASRGRQCARAAFARRWLRYSLSKCMGVCISLSLYVFHVEANQLSEAHRIFIHKHRAARLGFGSLVNVKRTNRANRKSPQKRPHENRAASDDEIQARVLSVFEAIVWSYIHMWCNTYVEDDYFIYVAYRP